MRRRGAFVLQGLESRDLLSGIISTMSSHPAIHGAQAVGGGGGATDGPVNLLLDPTGVPTPRQQARQQFVARFSGSYATGPGRFSSEAQQIYLRGAGGSNQFLHGDAQIRMITPVDPALPIGGQMTMFDRNLNSNSALGLDLVADPATGVDRFGRPTHLTIYQLDPNISSGVYAAGRASGTVDIAYLSRRRGGRGATSQGTAIITVRAQIYSLGTAFILTNADIDPRGPSQGGPDHKAP